MRRAGFDPSQTDLDSYTPMGLAAATSYLLEYQNVDDSALKRAPPLNVDPKDLAGLQNGG